jgi:hypothetical protein
MAGMPVSLMRLSVRNMAGGDRGQQGAPGSREIIKFEHAVF